MQIKILRSGEKFHLDNSVGAALVSAGLAELVPNAYEPKPPVPSPGWNVTTSIGGRATITYSCPKCGNGGDMQLAPPEGWFRTVSDSAFAEKIRDKAKFIHCGRQDVLPDHLIAEYIRLSKECKTQLVEFQPE